MQKWWRKWSYEIPLAFGDALWEVLVVQFADFLSRLTVRRVVEFIAIALLVMAFAQTAPIDLAFLFAGLATAFMFAGIWLEERDQLALFGDRYRQYRARVAMLLPGLF